MKILRVLLLVSLLLGCGQPDGAPTPTSTTAGSESEPAALEAALASDDPYERARLLSELLPELGSEAIPAVRDTLRSFPLHLGAVEFELLLRFWAEREPHAAGAWADEHSPPLYKMTATSTAIELLAEADPSAAVTATYRASAVNAELARVAQIALIRGWFRRDREEVLEYIEGLGTGTTRQRALYAYFLALSAAEGSDAAIAWAEAYPTDNESLKKAVYRQSLSALTWSDVPAALRFCAKHCDGPYGGNMRIILARHRLRAGDPGDEVMKWIQDTAEEGVFKQRTLWAAYSTWANDDHESAIEWIEQKIEAGETWVKELYGEYARQLAADEPARAIEIAEQIPDESDRKNTLVRIARYWRTVDEEAAEDWLEDSPLDEAARKFVRTAKQPNYLPRVPRGL